MVSHTHTHTHVSTLRKNNLFSLSLCLLKNSVTNAYKIQQHDDYEIDTDSSSRCSELPVLFDEVPLERCKLFHDNQAVHYNGKHRCDDQGDLQGGQGGRSEDTMSFVLLKNDK